MASYIGVAVIAALVFLNGSIQYVVDGHAVEWQQPIKSRDIGQFELLNRTAVQVSQSYIDPTRIDPEGIFLSAIAGLEAEVPQFVLITELGTETPIAFQLGQFRQDIVNVRFSSIWQAVFHISDALRMIARSGQVHEAQLRKLERIACQGLLSTLDQHSVVLTDADLFELKQNTLGRFGGIGVVIELVDEQLSIRDVMPNTPAEESGLRQGDIVTDINQDTTENITLNEAAELLRGPIGSIVSLGLMSRQSGKMRRVRMARTKIDVQSVSSRMLKGGIGYLKIIHFQEKTADEVRRAYQSWQPKPKGLIFDLRDNPGGLLDQAIAVSDLFLSQGEIVTTVGHSYEPTHTHFATTDSLDLNTPITLLINGSSASASEIMAAALQENRRAVIMGQPSYGKGTVQVLFEFPNETGLKLTVAQYLTPKRSSIQSVGVQPNVVLRSISPQIDGFDQVDAQFFMKRPPKHQLSIDVLSSATVRSTELEIAHQFLIQHLRTKQTDKDTVSSTIIAKLKNQYADELRYAFSKAKLQWQQDQCNHDSEVSLSVAEDGSPTHTVGGLPVSMRITNKGPHPTGAMLLMIRSGDHVQYLPTGGVDPKSVATIQLPQSIPINRVSHRCLVHFRLSDSCGRMRAEQEHLVSCDQPSIPTVRSLLHFSDDQKGNADGVLQAGERAHLNLSMITTRRGKSQDLNAVLTLEGAPQHRIARLLRGRDSTRLDGARSKDEEVPKTSLVNFQFEIEGKVSRTFAQSGKQPMQVIVRNEDGRELLRQRFTMPVYPSEPAATVDRGRLNTSSEPKIVLPKHTSIYFQPIQDAQEIGTAKGTFESLGRRGPWHLISAEPGKAWVKLPTTLADMPKHLSSDSSSSVDPYFVEAGRIAFSEHEEVSKKEHFTISGEVSGSQLLDYRFFHNGRKRTYQRFLESPQRTHRFEEAIKLAPGVNRLSIIVRSSTGHETSETLIITRK